MARKNSAAVAESMPYSINTVKNDKGVEVRSFAGIDAGFKKELIESASQLGGLIQTAKQKIQIALNLVSAFNAWKGFNPKDGLPKFVHDYVDSTCPASFGKVGTPARKEIEAHKVYNGIDYMFRKGKAALDKLNQRKALVEAGVDVNDEEKIRDHNKDVKKEKFEKVSSDFCKCIVAFHKFGTTETTISNLLITVLRKKEKDEDELNAVGKKLLDAAVKAVLRAQGVAVQETAKAVVTQVDVMDQLKESVTGKNNKKK